MKKTLKKDLGNIYISKVLFIETIEAIKAQASHDEKCSNAFSIILPDSHISLYNNSFLEDSLLKILQIAMNDTSEHSWIEFFFYDLDYGKGYYEGCASYKDGNPIDLSDAGKLWEFLVIDNSLINK